MINVPIAQSIRCRPVNSDRANFDNTFAEDTDSFPYSFANYLPAQDVPLQVVTPDDNESLSYLDLIHNGTRTRVTDIATSFIGQFKYETYTIPLATYLNQCCYVEVFLEVLGGGEVLSFKSEKFTVTDKPTFKLIEWFNSENSFQMDYSAGLSHVMQLDGKQWKLSYGGDISVYDNQGEETKLKEQIKRGFVIECELPAYMCEQLVLAMAHDNFYINEVEFVVSKKPVITQLGQSDSYTFNAEVVQKTIVGLNTHDVG